MSGHSKWAQIKRQKGANDAKRGLAFTKLSTAITIAVKQGGGIGDPDQNFRLRLAIEAAKAANMPKDNIQRAIEKAVGHGEGDLEETVYEGFGPGGISIIVEAATDNKNRTTSEVKSAFDKNGGSMGQPGSVAYQFKQVGRIILEKNGKLMDDIFLSAADSGAEDVEDVGDEAFIYTSSAIVSSVKDSLEKKGYTVREVDLIRKPLTTIMIDSESAQKVMHLLDRLEELDDVQRVYSNFVIVE
jgi:YebC/PmpR family DNA-binding regulatory protein